MLCEHKNYIFVDNDVRLMSSNYSLFKILSYMRVGNRIVW